MRKGPIKRVRMDTKSVNTKEGMDTNGNNTSPETVNIRVSNMTYTLDISDIRRAPGSRLCRYISKGISLDNFKRPLPSFEAVLAYYQTGELHMPLSLCPGAFATELAYWGLDPQVMAKCCYYRYISYQDDQETLDRFHLQLFPEDDRLKRPRRFLRTFRAKLWNVMDNVDTSIPTKIYFVVCMLMVVLSVLTLAVSTLPGFRRNLTVCEYEKAFESAYMTFTDPRKVMFTSAFGEHHFSQAVGKEIRILNNSDLENLTCDQLIDDTIFDSLFTDFEIETINKTITEPEIVDSTPFPGILPMNDTPPIGDPGEMAPFKVGSPRVSNDRLVNEIIETLRPTAGLQRKTVRIEAIFYMDLFLLAFFTLDILLRLFCCPSVRRYFLSAINVIDALVVVAAYIHLLVNYISSRQQYDTTPFDILEIFQVLRALRLLRVVRNVTCFKVLIFALNVASRDMLVLILYLLIGVAIFANFVFFVESEMNFSSIPDGWWWAINTMTTVGYGDIVPKTLYGKIIGAVCSVSGVLMMALAIPVFVKTFLLLYSYAVLYKKSLKHPEETVIYVHRRSTMRIKERGRSESTTAHENGTT